MTPRDVSAAQGRKCDHCDGTGEVLEPGRTPEEPSRAIPCGNCSAASASGPGCTRHKGDPHNLCEACWALEPAPSNAASLRERIIARAEHWEHDADEAQVAANSYKGVDNEAAVDLFRAAARSRSRALELRSLLEADHA